MKKLFTTGRDMMLMEEIEKARQEFREGKTITLASHEDIDKYFETPYHV